MQDTRYLEFAFNLLSFTPGPFWLMIFFFPRQRWAMRAVDVFLFLLAAHFMLLTFPNIPALVPVIANPTLESIRSILCDPRGVVGSWNHMILADLWIGRWVALDSLDEKYPIVVRLVFIFPILFFGPFGLFFYLSYRAVVRRKFWLTPSGSY